MVKHTDLVKPEKAKTKKGKYTSFFKCSIFQTGLFWYMKKKCLIFFQKQKHLLFLNSEMIANTTDTCDRKEEGPRGK